MSDPKKALMAGRLQLTAEEAAIAAAALDAARAAYETSLLGIAERIRTVQKNGLANRE